MKSKTTNKFAPEVRERAVRVIFDLRKWVEAAVISESMPCHAAAARFKVAASSAIK